MTITERAASYAATFPDRPPLHVSGQICAELCENSGARTVLVTPPRPSPHHADRSRDGMADAKSSKRESLPIDRAEFTDRNIRRFWMKVDKSAGPDGCWLWTARRDPDGYGKFQIGPKGRQRHMKAHRVAVAITRGHIDLAGLHRCDNPPCCNPAHVFEGTQQDNRRDCTLKARNAVGSRNGTRTHPETRPRGEAHGCAVLTKQAVLEMRRLRATGMPVIDIARHLGVSVHAAYQVLQGKTWRHLVSAGEVPR